MSRRIQRAQYIITLLISFLSSKIEGRPADDTRSSAIFNTFFGFSFKLISQVKLAFNSLEDEAVSLSFTVDQLSLLLNSLDNIPDQNCRIGLANIIGFTYFLNFQALFFLLMILNLQFLLLRVRTVFNIFSILLLRMYSQRVHFLPYQT